MPWTVPEYLRRDEPFVGDERAIPLPVKPDETSGGLIYPCGLL